MMALAQTKVETKRVTLKSFGYLVKADTAQGIVDAVVNVFGIIDLGDDMIHNGSYTPDENYMIHNGAYTRTLSERGNKVRVKVLDSHNTGSIFNVLGKPLEIREIGREELKSIAPEILMEHPEATGGLFTRTQYNLNTEKGREAFALISANDVNEYSIALDPLDTDFGKVSTPDGEKMVRHIRTLRLWEYSPVVFGMNQATATTDVKAAEADKAEPKQMTLGSSLEANMRVTFAFCTTDWLAWGNIGSESMPMLNAALEAGMSAMRSAIPASVYDQPMIEMWAAAGADTAKSGRVVSAANRSKIQACIDALQGLLELDAQDSIEDSADEAMTDDKHLTGTGALADAKPEATPSITADAAPAEAKDAAALLEQIDRESTEVLLMMEG